MNRLRCLIAGGIVLLQSLSATTASPLADCLNGMCTYTRANLEPRQAMRELSSQLSNTTVIFGPEDSRFEAATERYQEYNRPHIQMVVQPGREEDIPKIVRYANQNSINFLTRNRGHALIGTLGDFTGIQIDMRSLMDITINEYGKTAWFQGGTYDQQVIDELWEQGYVATTGSCACVGMMGPGLGGGYGRYQGHYGLISDNLVTLNVVLANGTAIRVSEETNPELLWAMKGAGHNFGIVTSFELKIYPRGLDTWYFKNYVFTQDKLERVIEEVNKLYNNGSGPVDMALQSGTYMMDPTVSETEAVVVWSFAYSGPQSDAAEYLDPFDAIGSVRVQEGNVPYTEIPPAQGSGMNDPLCATGYQHMHAHVGLWEWNVTAQRQIYDLYNEKVQAQPALNASIIMLEGYAMQGVWAVDENTSAFSWRNAFNVLGVITINYLPDPSLDDFANEWRMQTKALWQQGQPGYQPRTYVNYAWGDEPLEEVYGPALPELQRLKAQYDPEMRFRYYNPITPAA